MISHIMMYLFIMLDNIRHILTFTMGWGIAYMVIVITFTLLSWLIYADNGDEQIMNFINWLGKFKKLHIAIFVSVWLIFGFKSLIPTTKQMAIIYVVPKVANNEDIQKIPKNVLTFINKYLEESIGDEMDKIKGEIKSGKETIINEKDNLVSSIKKKARSILNEDPS